MAWKQKNEEGGAVSGMDRFNPAQEPTQVKGSTTKRVALFIFVAAGALFTLVTFTILDSDTLIQSSSAPKEVIEASRAASVVIPPPPKEAERPAPPAPAPAPQPPANPAAVREAVPAPIQVQTAEQETTQPEVRRSVRPAYLPAPGGNRARNVTDARRQNQAQRMQAASAPTAIQGFGRQEPQPGTVAAGEGVFSTPTPTPTAAGIGADLANGAMGAVQSNAAGFMPDGMDANSDPNGWGRKEAFRNQALPAEYSQHTRVFPVSALELKAGSLLPCVLLSGLNSDLPGNLIAQVSENVWDTATGRFLLIPRGSRLVGTYDNQITYGQNRALVIWSRLIFPDGSSLLLDNLQGVDQAGYSGFKGRVDRHWGQLLTSALLVSLVGAGVELAEPNNTTYNNNNNNNNGRNVGSILSERVATSIAQVMTQILSKNLSRQPTITVKPGYRFLIFVQHDVVFPRTWSDKQGR